MNDTAISAPSANAIGSFKRNTALRSWLRRPGPASIAQAVVSLPSMAKLAGPMVLALFERSSKFGSSADSLCWKSAVASATARFGELRVGAQPARFDLQLRQRAGALERAARSAARQVGIGQQLEPNGRDAREFRLAGDAKRAVCRRIAGAEQRAVGQQAELRPAAHVLVRRRGQHFPLRLVVLDARFPGRHALGPVGRGRLQFGLDPPHLADQPIAHDQLFAASRP